MTAPRSAVAHAQQEFRQAANLLEESLRGQGDFLTLPSAMLHARLGCHALVELFVTVGREAVADAMREGT